MTSEQVRAALEHRVSSRIPRGELWIGADIFTGRQVRDDIDAHLELCREMGMDFVSVPVGGSQPDDPGYRTFSPADIRKAAKTVLFVIAVLSGPFQRIVEKKGLHQALVDLARDAVEMGKGIDSEADAMPPLIEECAAQGADAIVIAEDLAYDMGTFATPDVLRDTVCTHYVRLVDTIHHHGAHAVFHSCGNITNLIPDIVSSGFDGLSCEQERVDLFSVKRTYGTRLTLLSGIGRTLLEADPLMAEDERLFTGLVSALGEGGGLILSSSTGLYSLDMLLNIKRLYPLV